MGFLDSDTGKQRLLTVEVPVIERYNEPRAAEYKIRIARQGNGLCLSYRLKPMHNGYELETRLLSSYPAVAPDTRVLTQLRPCPHILEGQTLCLWRQGSTRGPAAGTRRGSPACLRSRLRGAGWPATRSGTRPENGPSPRPDNAGGTR